MKFQHFSVLEFLLRWPMKAAYRHRRSDVAQPPRRLVNAARQ
jgi:hypothetical protein